MSFGSGSFGSSPFGSESLGGDSFSGLFSVSNATPIAKDQLVIYFSTPAVVNAAFKSIGNYTILDANGKVWPVLAVTPPTKNEPIAAYVLLKVMPLRDGETYYVQLANLLSRSGAVIETGEFGWTYNPTKTDAILASMPRMYDVSIQSNLRTILTALSLEDNIIGGTPGTVVVRKGEMPSIVELPTTITVETNENDEELLAQLTAAITEAFNSLVVIGQPIDINELETLTWELFSEISYDITIIDPNDPSSNEILTIGEIIYTSGGA